MPVIAVPEKDVMRAVMDLLAAERVWAIRLNTAAIRTAEGRPIHSHSGGRGIPDILATPKARVPLELPSGGYESARVPVILWVECKSSVGKQSAEQRCFELSLPAGHYYLLARSSDEVMRWLKEHR
jgi:hypothetical protein